MSAAASQSSARRTVKSVDVKILSTMLADEGFGEWGFAALVTGQAGAIPGTGGIGPNSSRSSNLYGGVPPIAVASSCDPSPASIVAARVSAALRSPPGTECAYTLSVVEARAWLSRWETVAMVPDLPEAVPTRARMQAGGVPTGMIELHRLRAGLDQSCRVADRVLDAHVVAEPRQVGDDQRLG